ncbi:prominin-like protein isoform X1 [Drosophila pseudoobscura]|uniref:Prominin-like protein isoform X1 n=1 Tax=Drosophila pseudoobscura pseudoobscura TaxID=46245 RepID=A0A6I8UTF3_DROPS|nr:prominin-like protein isoform X1 [Drosophila pseudoobscura]
MIATVHRRWAKTHCSMYGLVLGSLILLVLAQEPDGNEGPSEATTNVEGGDEEGTPSWWRAGYAGHGTTHEQVGQLHWPSAEYTKYKGRTNYTGDLTAPTKTLGFFVNITHSLFELVLTDDPALPQKYIMLLDDDLVALGPKVNENDWSDLLARYWLLLFFVIFLLAGIILMPCIGVCYCCLCCCRRCKQGCPACTVARDFKRRICCGICLAILILGLCLGAYIAIASNKFLERGFDDTSMTMRSGSEDTCVFLKDVADHITHLFLKNFMELETHLTDLLEKADTHIFLDLMDTSDSNALTELERILDNMPEALIIMRNLDMLEKELRYEGSQYRDCLRGLKRDLYYATSVLCQTSHSRSFHFVHMIPLLGYARCLHYDQIPNTTVYVEGIEEIIEEKYFEIPKRAFARLETVSDKIRKQMSLIIPPLQREIDKGRDVLFKYASKIRSIIEAVITDIHANTTRATKTYGDVYDQFGQNRDHIFKFTYVLIVILIIVLISGLVCGCFGLSRTAAGGLGFCSKSTGASCLLMAMIIIFCIYSFVTLVGLFHLFIGLVTYEGVCSSTSEGDRNTLFRKLDAELDVNRLLSPAGGDLALPPMRMSNAIGSCQANESIFHMLRANNLFNVDDLTRLPMFLNEPEKSTKFTDDLSRVYLLTEEEKTLLREMRDGNLSTYHASSYLPFLCLQYTSNSMLDKIHGMGDVAEKALVSDFNYWTYEDGATPDSAGTTKGTYHYYYWNCHVAFHNCRVDAEAYYNQFNDKLTETTFKMRNEVKKISELILYENLDFGESINVLLNGIIRAEKFIQRRGKEYINNLAQNLTDAINSQIRDYIDMIITESNKNVGNCQPLAYIYHRGINYVCERLVNPLNSAWLGLLLCSLLFLPILFVCHRLMCLYLVIYPAATAEDADDGHKCPVCTARPEYTPRPPGSDFPVGLGRPPRHLQQLQPALAEMHVENSKRKRE